jgi:hypothetical protein
MSNAYTLTNEQAAIYDRHDAHECKGLMDGLRIRLENYTESTEVYHPEGWVICVIEPLLTWEDGWVEDREGGVWHPSDEARAEIEASDDPAATAVRICHDTPLRGEWRS